MVASNNGIYNTVGASISGVTNTLTVTNPSNTASSAARETIVVGGGTAGDPTLNWNVSGVTNWEMGIDNSVSDNLTISQGTALGTNDTWRMTVAGQRTLPLQTAFFAYRSASVLNVTGDGTVYTPIFDTAVKNINSAYNAGTGVFTAPISGFYFLSTSVFILNGSPSFTGAGVWITATTDGIFGTRQSFAACANFGGDMQMTANGYVFMNAGDAASVAFVVINGTKTVHFAGGSSFGTVRNSFFSGCLVN